MNIENNETSVVDAESFPPAVPWAPAAVRLLKGIVYHDDQGGVWNLILAGLSPLTDYFARIGLRLVIDEEDGMAYLRQLGSEDLPDDYPDLPRLFHTTRLGFDASLLCVLLRDRLRQFEEEIHPDGRCVVQQQDLLEIWRTLVPGDTDEVRLNRTLTGQLKRLEELRFIKLFEKEPLSWEIKRILKARLPLSELESFRAVLVAELARRAESDSDSNETESHDR